MASTKAPERASIWLIIVGLFLIYSIYIFILRPLAFPDPQDKFWNSQARVGAQSKSWVSRIRSSIAALTSSRKWVRQGYDEFSQSNKVFALPRFGTGPLLVLPPTKVQTLIHYPESTISQKQVLHNFVATVTGDHDLQKNPIHIDLIRHQLTRKLQLVTTGVYDELVLGFQDQWPVKHGEWTSIKVVDTCTKIVSRAANRAFMGAELCRNAELLERIGSYSHDIFLGVALVNLLPFWLRPVLAPLIVRPAKKHLEMCKKLAVPTIKRRIAELREKKSSGTSEESQNADALQWLIEECIKKNDPAELDPVRICRRIVRVNMVAIHTTSTTIVNTILDLYTSPHTEEFIAGLREECTRVLAAHGGTWTKAAVNELYRVDSAIKESMRISGIFIAGMVRMVAAEGGVDFGDGIHVPKGVRVGTPNVAIHMDPEKYDKPDEYDPFRFSRVRETPTANGSGMNGHTPKDTNDISDTKPSMLAAVTTSDKFLSFGHGRGACPGRFFASQEMKLMLAHLIMTYDIKTSARPKNRDLGAMSVPDGKATIEVRLRDTN